MARLPLVDPETAGGPAAELLRRIAAERGRAFNVYRMLAHSPSTLAHVYALSSYLWNESSLPPPLQELVILRVAQLTRSDYEWARHRAIARRVGVSDAKVDALHRWRASGRFDAVERAGLAVTDGATRDVEASADAIAGARRLLGEGATVELVVLVGLYGMVARFLRSLAVDAEDGDEPMPR
jgi:4-carboxymuconolactone decarboxylase